MRGMLISDILLRHMPGGRLAKLAPEGVPPRRQDLCWYVVTYSSSHPLHVSHLIDRQHRGMTYDNRTRGSHATLLEVTYAEEARPQYADCSLLPVFHFGWMPEDSGSAHDHHFSGIDMYWGRSWTSPTTFPQEYLRPRFESLVTDYVLGKYPSDWRLVEGNFPPYGDEKAVYVTALLRPADSGYRSAYCVARFK
jgi:hypothetical protein